MDDHLRYGKHDPAGRNGVNSLNGTRSKTLVTEGGPVEVDVPRDRGVLVWAGDREQTPAAALRN
jgi:transposase-like protein